MAATWRAVGSTNAEVPPLPGMACTAVGSNFSGILGLSGLWSHSASRNRAALTAEALWKSQHLQTARQLRLLDLAHGMVQVGFLSMGLRRSESVLLQPHTDSQIRSLPMKYSCLRGRRISTPRLSTAGTLPCTPATENAERP